MTTWLSTAHVNVYIYSCHDTLASSNQSVWLSLLQPSKRVVVCNHDRLCFQTDSRKLHFSLLKCHFACDCIFIIFALQIFFDFLHLAYRVYRYLLSTYDLWPGFWIEKRDTEKQKQPHHHHHFQIMHTLPTTDFFFVCFFVSSCTRHNQRRSGKICISLVHELQFQWKIF